jgi:hypothetical protein
LKSPGMATILKLREGDLSMRKLFSWLLLIVLVFALAAPVLAQSQTYYHEVTVELDGEWEYNGSFVAPEVIATTTLKGIGKAKMHSITKAQSVPVWWDLF